MSEPVSALNGASWSDGIATVRECGLQGMITLRGDLSNAKVKKAVKSVMGVAVPETNTAKMAEARGVCWMSPDELLLLCPYEAVSADLEQLKKALGDAHALAVDVSDARAVFQLTGNHVRDVLSKLTPADLSPAAFPVGAFRRSRLAQAAGAFWMRDATTFEIICFRSVAQYMFDLLTVAAQEGSEVNYFTRG